MKKNPKIGIYIGAWTQNIGNAFFDLGAQAILKLAVPEATFYPMGGAVHWMFKESAKKIIGTGKDQATRQPLVLDTVENLSSNSLEIGEIAELDLLVFAGMSMCEEFVVTNGSTFQAAAKRGVAILGLGTGGLSYTEKEVEVFSSFLNSLKNYAIITRDEDTNRLFNGRISNVHSGIDCAFFLPEHYTPPRLAIEPYDVENFDKLDPHPAINHGSRQVIYCHHDLWGPLPYRYLKKPNTLVSDIPEDYLTLYSQVTETHSDRVHACVASLAYGNRARLYSNTPRKSLFARVGVPDIAEQVSKLDFSLLNDRKAEQVALARSCIQTLVG